MSRKNNKNIKQLIYLCIIIICATISYFYNPTEYINNTANSITIKNSSTYLSIDEIPNYEDENLVAKGVQIEAYSVEDKGKGVCFNVFVYNVQPGIGIDYLTGKSWKYK